MLFKNKILIVLSLIVVLVVSFVAIALPSQYVLPVLMYHSVKQSGTGDRLSVSPDNFKKQMDFLAKHKYRVISLTELANRMETKKPLPRHSVVITLDDGYEDNYLNAFPELKKNNFPAAIFVITGYVGMPGYMNWEEINQLAAQGIDIGSHTQNHAFLPKIADQKKLDEEINWSKKIIEYKLNRPVNFFCYPFGGMNKRARDAVIKAGYLGACAIHPGSSYTQGDPYAIRRIKVSSTDNLFGFWAKISGYYTLFKNKNEPRSSFLHNNPMNEGRGEGRMQ